VARCLLVVDIQADYFPGGAYPLVEPLAAAQAANRALTAFRAGGEQVVHVRHLWDAPDAPFLRAGTPGVEFHPLVAPEGEEPVVDKAAPNSFLGTNLQQVLADRGIDSLCVAGMMTSMCVDATVRAASDLGFDVTVVHDACAAPDLDFGDTHVPGAQVHAAFVAALADGYATVVSADDLAGPTTAT
jgi:nicotinamidase-related amidase